MGRATQGVRLITFKGDDAIASITKVEHEEETDEIETSESETDVDLNSEDQDTKSE
jgi:DNA gyrase subunit A